MKELRRILLIASLLSFAHFASYAWGVTGHRIVGEIAYRHLNLKARQKVDDILAGSSLAMASTWADLIRSDKSYDHLATWHYINVSDSLTEGAFTHTLMSDTAIDLYTSIKAIVKQLKIASDPQDSLRVFNLKMLVHLVGDAHQPMHVSRAADWGGNKINVTWFKDPSNLHKVWDEDLINFQQLSYTEYATAIDRKNTKEIAAIQHAPMEKWLYESYTFSQRFYTEITLPDQKLSYGYNFDHVDILNDRLYYAGIRLAGILNEIFGN